MARIYLISLVFLALVGCGRVDLHQGLTEVSADKILVTLNKNGIEARKEKVVTGQDLSWKVTVKQTDINRSREILVSHSLPSVEELGLSGVYKEKGLIPTPDEQKARFLLALKGEIVNSLEKIPGVVEADIVLNVPTESEFADLDPQKKRPTASTVVRIRNDPEVAAVVTEGKVQRFVSNSVPNLDPNDVTVIISRTDMGGTPATVSDALPPPPVPGEIEEGIPPMEMPEMTELAGVRLEPESVGRFKAYMVGLLGLLVAVSSFLLLNIIRLNRLKLRLQRGDRVAAALEPGGAGGLIGGPGAGGSVEGTFDVGARRQG